MPEGLIAPTGNGRFVRAASRALYQTPSVAETVNLDHIKRHDYMSHTQINPSRIVPAGPAIDYSAPHNRKPVVLQ